MLGEDEGKLKDYRKKSTKKIWKLEKQLKHVLVVTLEQSKSSTKGNRDSWIFFISWQGLAETSKVA